MKKCIFLSVLCAIATVLSAQQKMYVWINDIPTEYSVSEVDSVTFSDPEVSKPELLEGIFSVSDEHKVRFSRGNLQYTISTEIWSIAAHQYDAIGSGNVKDSSVISDPVGICSSGSDLADKIDMFGWSGSTSNAQWGISISTSTSDYSGDFVDWGQNIGNGTSWRTLTYDEWNYLINLRPNANNLVGTARIYLVGNNYVNGIVLLPDDWICPDGIVFEASFYEPDGVYDFEGLYFYEPHLSLAQWQTLEEAGAVFLPAQGGRKGAYVGEIQTMGYYWSATPDGSLIAYSFRFGSGGCYLTYAFRENGKSVRLVQDVE